MNMALKSLWVTEASISVKNKYSQTFLVAVGEHSAGYSHCMQVFNEGKDNPYVKHLVELVQKMYPKHKVNVFMWNRCDSYVAGGKLRE